MAYRKVARTVTGTKQTDGAGVKLTRVLSTPTIKDFDPFLMLDAFDSKNPADYTLGFPRHPHRGIETITYLIYGDVEHGDSLGNKGSIRDGECQWMTAGSGIIHQEMPKACPHMLGTQLWLNLPTADKMTEPAYRDITKDKVPVINKDGAVVKVISGEYKGMKGSIQGGYTKITYLDVELSSNTEWTVAARKDNTVFAYIVYGSACFEKGGELHDNGQALLFTDGDEIYVKSGGQGVRLLLLEGRPLREPVAWGGPIVMNTHEELQKAFEEIHNGTFIK